MLCAARLALIFWLAGHGASQPCPSAQHSASSHAAILFRLEAVEASLVTIDARLAARGATRPAPAFKLTRHLIRLSDAQRQEFAETGRVRR